MEKSYQTFYIKKDKENENGESPIFVRVTVGVVCITLSTGLKIETLRWKKTKQLRVTRLPADVALRNRLNEKKDEIEKVVLHLQSKKFFITPELLKDKIKHFGETEISKDMTLNELYEWYLSRFEQRVQIGEVSKVSLQKHKNVKSKISDYIFFKYQKKDFLLNELDYSFIVDFHMFLRTNKGIGHNSSIKMTGCLKQITAQALKRDWLSRDPFVDFHIKEKEVETVFLDEQELSILETKDFKNRSLDMVRDIFLFSCYTGYAPVDVKSLTMENIKRNFDGELWIFNSRQKTKIKSDVPILPKVEEIIEKYKDHDFRIVKGLLLPPRSNQRINAYLKEIADLCGIKKHLHYYVARHTFSTTISISNGISMEVLSKLLGHKKISQTQHYGKILDVRVSNEMKVLKEKMRAKSTL